MAIRHIISVDPGDVNNGFCYFKHDSTTKTADTKIMKICGATELSELLKVLWGIAQAKPATMGTPHEGEVPANWQEQPNPHNMFFVIENFRVDTKGPRGAIFQWQEMLTSEMIGRVKLCAEWLGAPVYMQEPGQVLYQGRKYASGRFTVPKGHIPDDQSAWMHGVHWMLQKKLIQTADQVMIHGQGPIL